MCDVIFVPFQVTVQRLQTGAFSASASATVEEERGIKFTGFSVDFSQDLKPRSFSKENIFYYQNGTAYLIQSLVIVASIDLRSLERCRNAETVSGQEQRERQWRQKFDLFSDRFSSCRSQRRRS